MAKTIQLTPKGETKLRSMEAFDKSRGFGGWDELVALRSVSSGRKNKATVIRSLDRKRYSGSMLKGASSRRIATGVVDKLIQQDFISEKG